MRDQGEVIRLLVEAICELSKANCLTGIWDNRRFRECKKAFEEVDCRYLYKTERLSRGNVELRAVYRGRIDALFETIVGRRGFEKETH